MWLLFAALAALQLVALLALIGRLSSGWRRRPPVRPEPAGLDDTTVSVLLPTLDEGPRVGRCLEGLHRQGAPLVEVLVIDSDSRDETRALVRAMAERDARFRLIDDPPLPPGWIGKVWALEHGRRAARGEWLLGVDADTEARAGMVAGAVGAAREYGLDVVSFSPRFGGMSASEQWIQPALLATLVYRVGAAGARRADPMRVMANGQCFLARADVLAAGGGYTPSRTSFSDDVTLARHYAARGVSVGFLDGSQLYTVRAYSSLGQMWREWGRSIDLSDSTTRVRQWGDVLLLLLTQALPLPVLVALGLAASGGWRVLATPNGGAIALGDLAPLGWLLVVNSACLVIRLLLLGPLSRAYDRPGLGFWLSPLADPLAVLRIVVSSVRRPTTWRGRRYVARTVAG